MEEKKVRPRTDGGNNLGGIDRNNDRSDRGDQGLGRTLSGGQRNNGDREGLRGGLSLYRGGTKNVHQCSADDQPSIAHIGHKDQEVTMTPQTHPTQAPALEVAPTIIVTHIELHTHCRESKIM